MLSFSLPHVPLHAPPAALHSVAIPDAPPEEAPRVTERPREKPEDPHQQDDAAKPGRSGDSDKWKKIERAPSVGPM